MHCDRDILNDTLVDELKSSIKGNGFWRGYLESLSASSSTPFSIHLAILLQPYLKFILEGSKTVESRFSRHRIAPYGSVEAGDVVLLKGSSAKAVSGLCIVRKVWSYQLNPDNLQFIKNGFAAALRAEGPSFWEERKAARFATLIRIAEVYPLPPIKVRKRDRRGWVVLRSRQQEFIDDGGIRLK